MIKSSRVNVQELFKKISPSDDLREANVVLLYVALQNTYGKYLPINEE
jgi:hypothetical protein